jgi:hypothetical protein
MPPPQPAARAAARAAEEAEQQRRADLRASNEAALLRAAFEQRLAEVEAENAKLKEDLNLISGSVTNAFEQLTDSHVLIARETREEIRSLKVEVAKLGSVAAELRSDSFKFPGDADSQARRH